MDYQWKDENEYKKYSKPFSQFLFKLWKLLKICTSVLNYETLSEQNMGRQLQDWWNIVKETIFQLFGIELQGIFCLRDKVKIWCNSVPYILWGRKGKPLMGGIHSGDVWSIL